MEIKKLNREIIKERFGIEFFEDDYRIAVMTIMKKVYGEKSVASNLVLEEILVEWDNFVTDLRNGYEMSVYEFENDLDAYRGPIEQLTSNRELDNFEDHKKLKLIVDNIDNRFKELTIEVDLPSRKPWWSKTILLKADSEYFDTLGIDLTPYNIERT